MTSPTEGLAQAQVYFIQDDGVSGVHQHYTLRIGVDGTWVGAYKHNSYFYVTVEPGLHHLCANVQADSSLGQLRALRHFTAGAGKTYYFRTRFVGGTTSLYPGPQYIDFDEIDSDEGEYLISSSPSSTWHTSQ